MSAPFPPPDPAAFETACWLDIATRKPGNVSLHSAGHNMEAQQFLASAAASAPALFAPALTVGERIEQAIAATWRAVGCNTNLGIVLLCAPLAHAWISLPPNSATAELRTALEATLAGLTRDDTAAAFRAIAMANPAGLGRMEAQDVHGPPPTMGLREAMRLAADRDEIARQYANGFDEILNFAVPVFLARLDALAGDGRAGRLAMRRTFLHILAHLPDTHIARKYGHSVAQSVTAEALPWLEREESGEDLDALPAFAAWDAALKARAINPGTTADLCVATALAAQIVRPDAARRLAGERERGRTDPILA